MDIEKVVFHALTQFLALAQKEAIQNREVGDTCPAGDGFVPGACQREEDGGNEHVGYAPGAAAAVVAQRGEDRKSVV